MKRFVLFLVLAIWMSGVAKAVNYQTIANGNWGSPSTWQGGLVPDTTAPVVIPVGDTVRINHTVSYLSATGVSNLGNLENLGRLIIETTVPAPAVAAGLYIPNSINIDNRAGALLEVRYAKLIQCRFTPATLLTPCGNTGVAQNGIFKNESGTVTVIGSVIEIAQDWTNVVSGTRTMIESCVFTGQNISHSNSIDVIRNSAVSIGWQGSGNVQFADGSYTFENSEFQLASSGGSFEINSGAIAAGSSIDYITLQNTQTGTTGNGGIVAAASVTGMTSLGGYWINVPGGGFFTPNGKFTPPTTVPPNNRTAQFFPSSLCNQTNNTLPTPPSLSKSFAPMYIAPGGVAVLTIQITNSSSSTLTLNQTLTDNLPTNVTVAVPSGVTTTCGGVPSTTATSVSLPIGTTIPATPGCTLTVSVTSSLLGQYNNIIPVGALSTNAGSNTTAAAAPLTVLEPSKAVRLAVDADTSTAPSVGDTLQYRIEYSLPLGATPISGFQIFDVLPSQVTFSSLVVTPSGGSPAQTGAANASYTGIAGASTSGLLAAPVTLQAGGSLVITLNATINNTATNGTAFDNTARGSGAGLPAVIGNGTSGGLPSDADATAFGSPASALAQTDTAASGEPTRVTPIAPNADLVLTKSQPNAVVNSGGTITYTITVTNNGPATANNVVVTDTLPTGTTFVSATSNISPSAGVLTWNGSNTPTLVSLANGASQTFMVMLTVP
jgi:uncharacterized repeat protein (TIGR01451 family)/fimbrial isopeptide formation D2 family protein